MISVKSMRVAFGIGLPLAAALLVALVWWSRQSPRVEAVKIGVISLTEVDNATFEGFRAGLEEQGYRDSDRVVYLRARPAGDIGQLDARVAEVLAQRPDLILVSSTPATLAVKRATASNPVPTVFAPVNDPVKAGIVDNARMPGGHFTGVRLPRGDELRLQWLRLAAPAARRVLIPYNPRDPSSVESLSQLKRVAAGLDAELVEVATPDAEALSSLLRQPPAGVQAILLPRDSLIEARIADFVRMAHAGRLPLSVPSLAQVEAGALISYGFVHREIGRQAANLAGQILRGVPPGDLPVETAAEYLAVNVRAADSIGLRVSDALLRQAQVVLR